MKQFALCIGGLFLLTGQRCDLPVEITDDAASGYRKITLTGTIHTDNNEATVSLDPGEGLVVFEYTADYSIELWFPMEGGEAVQQRNTIALTAYDHVCYGTADDCIYTPEESAYEQRTFEFEASLTLDGIYENDLPADELSVHLPTLPVDPITVTALCPNGIPGDYADPTVFSSLLTYYYMSSIVWPTRLNDHVTDVREDYPLSLYNDMYLVDITETRDYTIVSSLD